MSAVDSYPTRFVVRCADGALRHDGHFETRSEALDFADRGHCCLAVSSHEIVELVEVSPGATLPVDEAERYITQRDLDRALAEQPHEVARFESVGYSLLVLLDIESGTYSTRRIGQVSLDKIDEREHDSLGAALAHCTNEVLAELEESSCDIHDNVSERVQLVTSLVSRRCVEL